MPPRVPEGMVFAEENPVALGDSTSRVTGFYETYTSSKSQVAFPGLEDEPTSVPAPEPKPTVDSLPTLDSSASPLPVSIPRDTPTILPRPPVQQTAKPLISSFREIITDSHPFPTPTTSLRTQGSPTFSVIILTDSSPPRVKGPQSSQQSTITNPLSTDASNPSPEDEIGTTNSRKGKTTGVAIAGVAGAVTGAVLLGFLIFFYCKWRNKKQFAFRARKRFSLGPLGNGIDASTGSALVAGVAYKGTDCTSLGDSMFEKEDHAPLPQTRYFGPGSDINRSTPIPAIDEGPERLLQIYDSYAENDIEKVPPATSPPGYMTAIAVEKPLPVRKPTLIVQERQRPLPPPSFRSGRSGPDSRSHSAGSIGDKLPPISNLSFYHVPQTNTTMTPSPTDILRPTVWTPPGYRNSQTQQPARSNTFTFYSPRSSMDPSMFKPARTPRRSVSVGGELDGPFHRHSYALEPLGMRPVRAAAAAAAGANMVGRGGRVSPLINTSDGKSQAMTGTTLGRRTSGGSLRERPSPTLWNSTDYSNPLHARRSRQFSPTPPLSGGLNANKERLSHMLSNVGTFVQGELSLNRPGDAAKNF